MEYGGGGDSVIKVFSWVVELVRSELKSFWSIIFDDSSVQEETGQIFNASYQWSRKGSIYLLIAQHSTA